MASRRAAARGAPRTLFLLAGVLVLLLPSTAVATPFPVLPLDESNGVLAGLSVPVLAPGSSGTLVWTVHNPLGITAEQVAVQFQVYAFNAYPGNATSTVGSGPAPELANDSGVFGSSISYSVGPLATRAGYSGATSVLVPTGTPLGAYAIRCSVRLVASGTTYLLESRGYFSASAWSYATNGSHTPTGLPELNVSRLNVSGVVPETAVTVLSSTSNLWIYGLLGGALVAAGVGGYYGLRRGPGSSSGARTPLDDSNAESALGNSRTSDGD